MELFDQNGCLTEEGLHAVIGGQLDELGRLEAAEHLSYCDKCMDRYTALLTADVLEEPPETLGCPVQDREPKPTLSQKLTGTLDSLLFGKNESAAEPEAAVSNQKK